MVSVANEGQGQTALEWRTGPSCPSSLAEAERTGDVVGQTDAPMVKIGGAGPTACVWVVARDRQGARALDTHPVAVTDPQLVLQGPAALVSGQQAEFVASYPDEPELWARFYWATAPDCATARTRAQQEAGATRELRRGDRFPHRIPRQGFCVVVLARDTYDVDAVAELAVAKPMNGDPYISSAAATTLAGPVPLFSDVRLGAGQDNDFLPDEPVTFTWKITTPGGAELPATYCPEAKPAASKICFQPALAGTYKIDLSITEGGVSRAAPPVQIEVEDTAPCIRETFPPFDTASRVLGFEQQPREFTVMKVDDDGDPLPPPARPSQREFSWSIRELDSGQPGEDTFRWIPGEQSPIFIIPARRYQALQRVEVRLFYRDRLTVADREARKLSCKPEEPRCEVRPGCFAWVTWTVEYQ